MTRLLLIRHGETIWNQGKRYQGHSDISLSKEGEEQAQKLADYIIKKHIALEAIYASDLSRALQTAQAVAEQQKLTVQIHQGFREINFGVWEGLTFPEIQEQYADLAKLWLTAPEKLDIPKGESFLKVKQRAEIALTELLQKHEGKNIAIVSHGGTLRTLICSLLGVPMSKMWQFKLDNTALTIFEFFKKTSVLSLYNSTAHLD